jgi:hypothetical protein
MFYDFYKNFPAASMSEEIAEEFQRVGMKVADAFRKVAESQDWFRVTFNELKYIPGAKE